MQKPIIRDQPVEGPGGWDAAGPPGVLVDVVTETAADVATVGAAGVATGAVPLP
jgi:hypothetical protein